MIGTEPGCIHCAQFRWLRIFAKKLGRVKRPNQTAFGVSATFAMSADLLVWPRRRYSTMSL